MSWLKIFRLEEGEGFCGKINVQKSLKLKDVEGRWQHA